MLTRNSVNKPNLVVLRAPVPGASPPTRQLVPFRALALGLAIIAAIFTPALYRLGRFALGSALYSYIALIPFVSLYVMWQRRASLPPQSAPNRRLAALMLFTGGALLCASFFLPGAISIETQLAVTTSSFLLTAAGMTAWFIGRELFAALLFPIGFLVFLIPMPGFLLAWVDWLMQHGSAVVARLLFDVSGTTVFYQELNFQLAGAMLHVAPECSGIRSTIALTIVSVVTGYYFLRSPVHRTLLVTAVLPLALLRNGFRIFTIGELCVHFGPQMINSWIHRRGGPIFFAASLVPFFVLVFALQARERRLAAKRIRSIAG